MTIFLLPYNNENNDYLKFTNLNHPRKAEKEIIWLTYSISNGETSLYFSPSPWSYDLKWKQSLKK